MQVLAHNLLAQYSSRQLNITSGKKAKASEKLSSGYRINRSADDAAGLSISEKMRSQIRGLNRASKNIQDGISLVQVADGALEQTHEILQRMRELSVQAANDTNQDIDRAAIQAELDALTQEVDRIADNTSFNDGIYPLKNDHSIKGSDFNFNDPDNSWQLPDCLYVKQHEIMLDPGAPSVQVDGVKYTGGQSVTIPVVGFQIEDGGRTYYACYADVDDNDYGAYRYNNYESFLDVSEMEVQQEFSGKLREMYQVVGKRDDETNLIGWMNETSEKLCRYRVRQFCKNQIINSVIYVKKKKADAAGIRMDINIHLPEQTGVEALDLCSIFCNLLDNAIEACEKVSGERYIRLAAEAYTGYLMITETNSMEGKLRRKNGKILSSKMEQHQHGYGLGLITVLSRKYGGEIEIKEKEGTFRILVVLNPDVVQSGI